MAKGIPITVAEEDRILDLYASGLSCEQVAPLVGRGHSSVSNVLRRRGAQRRGARHGQASHSAGDGKARRWGYSSWQAIRQRCTNPKCPAYKRYGARGITVCAEWRDSFVAFIAYIGPRPSLAHTVDRYPNKNGNYEPGNVRWATPGEQSRNRNNTLMLGDVPLVDAAAVAGRHYQTAVRRLKAGLAPDAVVAPPKRPAERCADPTCERKPVCKGLCKMHYGRARNVGRVRLRDLPEHKQTASDGASRGWEARLARAREQQHGRYGILSLLAGEVTTADLAKRVGKRNNTVRMALVALHAEGLVEKVGPGLWRRCG